MLAALATPSRRQSVLSVGDQAIIGGTNFLTAVAIGRWCGPEELGVFGVAITFVYLLVATQEPLVTTPFTVFIARTKSEAKPVYRACTLLSYLALSAMFVTLLCTATIASVAITSDRHITYVLASLTLLVPCWLLREFARRCAYAEFNLRVSVVINSIAMVIQIVGLTSLAMSGHLSAATGLLILALANFAAGATWFFAARSSMEFSGRELKDTIKRHWRIGKVMMLSQVVNSLSGQALPWLIMLFRGATATGAFVACEQVIRLANPLMVGLTNILNPRVAHAFAKDGGESLRHIVQRAMVMFGLLMAIFCVIIALLGSQILGRLFGAEYAPYAMALTVLAISKAIDTLAIGPARGLVVLERVNDCLKADVVRCVVTLTATLALVGQLGILGAAYGTLLGSTISSAVILGCYWRATSLLLHLPQESLERS